MTLNIYTDDSSPMSTSDVESFTGKIVCNIDGSSYIIDAENATLSSLNDNSLSVAATSVTNEETSSSVLQSIKISPKSFVNFNVSAAKETPISSVINSKLSASAKSSFPLSCKEKHEQVQEQTQQQKVINPKIHTFRVVNANDANIQLRQGNKYFKIQKPILMCFICKLSFGITKSFSLHANTEHGLDLQDLQKHLLMQREYSSAIIQRNMDENPQISFLEPVDMDTPSMLASPRSAELSGMVAAQLDNDITNKTEQTAATSTEVIAVVTSASNTSSFSSKSILSRISSSSSSSFSSSSPLSSSSYSPCCTTNTIITPSTTTSSGTNDVVKVTASLHPEEQQSQCMYDSTTPTQSDVALAALNTTTTLGSLNLDKTKTKNYYISDSAIDNLTTSNTLTTTTLTTCISTTSSLSAAATITTATFSSSITPPLLPPPLPPTSSLSLTSDVDLSACTGNLATDAISTDSLVNIHKSTNDNSNNDSIEPQSQDITNTTYSSNLCLKSHHVTPHQSSLNTSIMSDFLQQHLRRLSAGGATAEDDCQHQNLENDNMSWSQQTANTFSLPATISNASVAEISSLHASLSALNADQNTSSVKLISKFLQHQLVAAQQQQQQQHQKQLTSHSLNKPESYINPAIVSTASTSSMLNMCPEHPDYKGIDCKTCEMLEAHQSLKSSPQEMPQRSPTNPGIAAAAAAAAAAAGLLTAANQLSMSPSHSLNANNLPSGLNVSLNTPPLSNPSTAASFTIGACSDHINGRPLGVECARCEMILNSARLNSNVQMSTRNSCKTLKCPQCNWHYKYQETLEIHMREKHPDGESACGYCLAGQQHPRLARGESYSCGYKPYRCEICNYSTTTKGNLSIHMQSDKHLNNMQELNSSQNMVAAAVAVAAGGVGKLDAKPKINLATTMGSLSSQHQQQQQQHQQQQAQLGHSNVSNSGSVAGNLSTSSIGSSSASLQSGKGNSGGACGSSNKPKPSFRCDICSYETSVARNLRIHMTSEKHTHNMAVLQNNIKHIQALSFLQQQQQTQQQQQQGNNFMPEVAMADLAYNQALMIQLLHQNAAAATAAQAQIQPSVHSPLAGTSSALISATKPSIKQQASSPSASSEMPTSPFSPISNELGSSDLTTSNMEPPLKPDLWPTTLFSCLICSNFNANSLDELNTHLMIDRSRQIAPLVSSARSISPTASNVCMNASNSSMSGSAYFSDIMIFQNNNYICRLCNYKTNLKANYQLHSKTDKHLQKLNFINHLREGGPANEYKLKYYQEQQQQIGANTVQVKCNSCDFYTNSIQKLSLHTQHMRHETMIMIFQHLNYLLQQQRQQHEYQQTSNISSTDDSSTNLNCETAPLGLVECSTSPPSAITTTASSLSLLTSSSSSLSAASAVATLKPTSAISCNKSLLCHLCKFIANSLLEMIQHVKSIRHLQVEQFVCLQRRSEQLETPNLDDVFKLCNKSQRNNDTTIITTLSSTSTNTSTIIDNKTSSPSSSACFTNLIESEHEDFPNKMFFDPNEEIENNTCHENLGGLASSAHLAHLHQNSSRTQPSTEKNANPAPCNIPAIIYKCNSCDFFGQLKEEIEAHIETVHPNSESSDIISIPTNPVAIQAFQAAMAAATLAAVSRASKTSSPAESPSSMQAKVNATNQDNEDDLCPVAVKRERLDLMEVENSPEEPIVIVNEPNTAMEVIEVQEGTAQSKQSTGVQCPLCQDIFIEKTTLETHLMTVHSVNKDGLARLLLLVDTSMWQCEKRARANRPQQLVGEASPLAKAISDTTITSTKPPLTGYELSLCQQCGSSFKHEQQLLQHAQKMQHYTMQKGEYLCLAFSSMRNSCKMLFPSLAAMFNHYNDTHMRLVISERHVYKYRCKQCSLAFKTQEKLATHTLYHTMRDATKCAMCQRNFRSTQALQKHMEQTHSQITTTIVGIGNNMECASPRTISPSCSETGRLMPETSRTATASDRFESESNRSVTPGQDICAPTQSAGSTQNEPQSSPSPSTQHQEQMSTITALINQQQQTATPSDLLHHLQLQHQQFQSLPALHNLQQMQQQLPQFSAAVAASGIPINPVEVLNLMQFHHLISLNFMNLAPPLIFGGNAAAASSIAGSNSTTSTNMPNNNVSQPPTHIAPASDLTSASSSTSSTITPTSVSVLPNVDVSAQILQQQHQQISPGASNSQLLNNQKRARTRITDDQLKILRAHFDINNSPSEESILQMSQKANLPMKVVKHWFRNTLFKERQRNKDSPYNFNNPPSTTLNLEEYERTGQTKVMPLTEQLQNHQLQIPSRPSSAHSISNTSEYSNQQQQQQQMEHKQREEAESLRSQASSAGSSAFPLDVQIKTEPGEDLTTLPSPTITVENSTATAMTFLKQQHQQKLRFSSLDQQDHDLIMMSEQSLSSAAQQQQHAAAVVAAASFYNSYETKSESESSDIHSRPHTPNSSTTSNLYASMSDLLSQQMENIPLNQMGPPKKFQLNPNTNPGSNISSTPSDRNMPLAGSNSGSTGSGGITVSSKLFEKHSPSAQYDNNSNSSNSSTTSSGKRANRTRFTDYQIKVLQEFFENNSYPKDSDLEYLSKLLLLSPRVIVVWFQNARQKQRKIYENQPNNSLYESEEKKQNINYACKKCSLVFQRYYELIRHQKNHCFKEENNKKSAKAQIAAAQIAQNLSSEDSNSSMDINSSAAAALLAQHHPAVGVATAAIGLGKNTLSAREFSPIPSNATTPPRDQGNSNNSEHQKFVCDKCKLTFTHFDHFREHQLMHLVNPNLHLSSEAHTAASTAAAVAAYGPFGSILQSLQQAAHLQQAVAANSASGQPTAKKRKYSETSSNADDVSSVGGFSLTGVDYDSHAKKYNLLYQYFLQNEGNSDLRQQFHSQDSAKLNMEFLANYYQQTELKKRTNYEFLFQYYVGNEQQTNANFDLADNKPNIEFLLQYYQLCESKKFFQLEASPQRIHDVPLMQGGIDTAQHNTTASSNSNISSRPASDDSERSSPGASGVNEESNGGGVVNNIENEQHSPLMATYSTEYKTRSNGQHCNNKNKNSGTNSNNNEFPTNIELNNHNFCQNTAGNERLNNRMSNKLEEQMDQLDGLQEVKNQTNSNHAGCSSAAITARESPILITTDNTSVLGSYYQNLEDFLDATMIENHNQTLIFNTETHNTPDLKKISEPNSISLLTHAGEAANHIPESSNQKQANKRLRTTILPEQLNFLYECYQNESNPSRKMLEEIAKKVNLKKRVVQVWFQNTRAKDKKSRNQQRKHFSNISDDNSNSSSTTNNNIKGDFSELTNSAPMVTVGSDPSNDIIRDCDICQLTQVNIQQHAFTVEHIRKVKELLAQTTAATAAASLLQDDKGEVKSLLHDYRDKQTLLNGDQPQNINQQQQQLALMMMAFQTQNMSKSMMTYKMQDANSAAGCNTADEKLEKKFQNKYFTVKDQKKPKRNPLKKKKATTKKTIENLAKDDENLSNFNATHLINSVSHHYNTSHCGKLSNNFKSDKFSLYTNKKNYGYNNNNHVANTEINDDGDPIYEADSENCRNIIKNNCESINDNKDIVKSQIYNYNNTITGNTATGCCPCCFCGCSQIKLMH